MCQDRHFFDRASGAYESCYHLCRSIWNSPECKSECPGYYACMVKSSRVLGSPGERLTAAPLSSAITSQVSGTIPPDAAADNLSPVINGLILVAAAMVLVLFIVWVTMNKKYRRDNKRRCQDTHSLGSLQGREATMNPSEVSATAETGVVPIATGNNEQNIHQQSHEKCLENGPDSENRSPGNNCGGSRQRMTSSPEQPLGHSCSDVGADQISQRSMGKKTMNSCSLSMRASSSVDAHVPRAIQPSLPSHMGSSEPCGMVDATSADGKDSFTRNIETGERCMSGHTKPREEPAGIYKTGSVSGECGMNRNNSSQCDIASQRSTEQPTEINAPQNSRYSTRLEAAEKSSGVETNINDRHSSSFDAPENSRGVESSDYRCTADRWSLPSPSLVDSSSFGYSGLGVSDTPLGSLLTLSSVDSAVSFTSGRLLSASYHVPEHCLGVLGSITQPPLLTPAMGSSDSVPSLASSRVRLTNLEVLPRSWDSDETIPKSPAPVLHLKDT